MSSINVGVRVARSCRPGVVSNTVSEHVFDTVQYFPVSVRVASRSVLERGKSEGRSDMVSSRTVSGGSVVAYPGGVRQAAMRGAVRGGVSPRMRLTRRGRIVFASLFAFIVAAGVWGVVFFASTAATASSVSGPLDGFEYTVVAPGQTLWQLAQELDPGADPRDLIHEIVSLNQLAGAQVQAGQQLAVPARYAKG